MVGSFITSGFDLETPILLSMADHYVHYFFNNLCKHSQFYKACVDYLQHIRVRQYFPILYFRREVC